MMWYHNLQFVPTPSYGYYWQVRTDTIQCQTLCACTVCTLYMNMQCVLEQNKTVDKHIHSVKINVVCKHWEFNPMHRWSKHRMFGSEWYVFIPWSRATFPVGLYLLASKTSPPLKFLRTSSYKTQVMIMWLKVFPASQEIITHRIFLTTRKILCIELLPYSCRYLHEARVEPHAWYKK